MKLQVFEAAVDVPKKYNAELRKLGLPHGSIRSIYFDDIKHPPKERICHEIVIITHNDIPVSWGLMIKGDCWSYKSAMFYTKKTYRCRGLAARIHDSMKERHPRFSVYADSRNAKFFKAVGRKISFW